MNKRTEEARINRAADRAAQGLPMSVCFFIPARQEESPAIRRLRQLAQDGKVTFLKTFEAEQIGEGGIVTNMTRYGR